MKFLGVEVSCAMSDAWTLQELMFELKPSLIIVETDEPAIEFVLTVNRNLLAHRVQILSTRGSNINHPALNSSVTDMADSLPKYRRDFPGRILFWGDEFAAKLVASLSQHFLSHDYVVLPDSAAVREAMTGFTLSAYTSRFQANQLLYYTK